MDPAPPPVQARFFYASLLAIDDPLSPVPPPSSSTASKLQPRPFSAFDNGRLDAAWHELRKTTIGKQKAEAKETATKEQHEFRRPLSRASRAGPSSSPRPEAQFGSPRARERAPTIDSLLNAEADVPATTGTPFIRAPNREERPPSRSDRSVSRSRPVPRPLDSYRWDEDAEQEVPPTPTKKTAPVSKKDSPVTVPVGVSRLHQVAMPSLTMEPIYWSPVNDIAAVIRATWFYKDTMMPVEVSVANMLELGYTELQAWTQTWQDELNSAVQVGAAGEERILRKLWPDIHKPATESRPPTAKGEVTSNMQPLVEQIPSSPETQREKQHAEACETLNSLTGPDLPDNRASGSSLIAKGGSARAYSTAGVIYATATEAHLLKPSLQPSSYYGRRPLASYIKKGRKLGIPVVRGFDQTLWDKLYPSPKRAAAAKADAGVSTNESGMSPELRQLEDPELAHSIAPRVTDLILVIHGIGQKLSERMESFHFTHAMNAFRREVNVELGTDKVRKKLRKDAGGMMLLPVNWRQTLSFEEGGYRSESPDAAENLYGLKDITPESLPSVRNIVSDVMLDIPYYLSHHQPKMIAAVIKEANRIYKLWCANNPSFVRTGRVHIIAHSLGSVMAVDILSKQPSEMPADLTDPAKVDLNTTDMQHFLFPVNNLFFAGSPAGFFLLLKQAPLRPRIDLEKPDSDPESKTPTICGTEGDYGCIAVDNVYNIINPYDPVSYRLNATVDAAYSAMLKPAWLPSAASGWFGGGTNDSDDSPGVMGGWFGGSSKTASDARPNGPSPLGPVRSVSGSALLPHLPSNVELATHDFTREEIAEKRMYALNDNGQIDFLIRYGGGPLEIQYLTMLGAHSSYWLLKDFVRVVVTECGREPGRSATRKNMRAVKKKSI